MNNQQSNTRQKGLEREILLWVEILKLWQNRLQFLTLRIQAVRRPDQQILIASKKEDWLHQINFLADSVISDYLESLSLHQTELMDRRNTKIDIEWFTEHNLFRRHLFQLKKEYLKLSNEIYYALESSLIEV